MNMHFCLPILFISTIAAAQVDRLENRACGVDPNRTFFRNNRGEITALFFQNAAPPSEPAFRDFAATLKTPAQRKQHVADVIAKAYRVQSAMEDAVRAIGDRYIAKKLAWMGFEISAAEVAALDEAGLSSVLDAIEKQLTKDRVKKSDVRAYFLARLGPVLYARWKNPSLRQIAKLVPLDDAESRRQQAEQIGQLEVRSLELQQLAPGSGLVTSQMISLVDLATADFFSGRKDRSPEFQNLVAKIKKPEVKKKVLDFRTWIEAGIDVMAKRDRQIAEAIVKHTAGASGGIAVVSRVSGPGVTDHLMDSCANSSGSKVK